MKLLANFQDQTIVLLFYSERGYVQVYFIPFVNISGKFHSYFSTYLIRSVTNVQMLNMKEMVISSLLGMQEGQVIFRQSLYIKTLSNGQL